MERACPCTGCDFVCIGKQKLLEHYRTAHGAVNYEVIGSGDSTKSGGTSGSDDGSRTKSGNDVRSSSSSSSSHNGNTNGFDSLSGHKRMRSYNSSEKEDVEGAAENGGRARKKSKIEMESSRSRSRSSSNTGGGMTYAELSARIKQDVAEREGKSKAQENKERMW